MSALIEDTPRRALFGMPEVVVEWLPTAGPGASDGDWADITEYARDIVTGTGRQYELDQFRAGTASLTLVATDRTFDYENANGPFFPYLTPMRQVRITAVEQGPNGLITRASGAYASAPDTAGLAITGDMQVDVYVLADSYHPGSGVQTIIGQWATGNQGWALQIVGSSGQLRWTWSTTGADTNTADSTVSDPLQNHTTDGTGVWLRAVVDVNTGGGNGSVSFFYSFDGVTWSALGTTITTAATSIFNSTAPLKIAANDTNTNPFSGITYKANVYRGIGAVASGAPGGVLVANPDFTPTGAPIAQPGTTSYVDSFGNVFTLAGAASIPSVDTLYSVWRGYITKWGQTAQDDRVFTTLVSAADAFTVLEQIKLPSSAWALEVQKDNPSMWFRLGETDTARVTDSSAGGNYGLYQNVVQGAAGLVPNDNDGAVDIGSDPTVNAAGARVTIQNPTLLDTAPFTVSGLIKLASNAAKRVVFAGTEITTTPSPAFTIYVGTDDALHVDVNNNASSRSIVSRNLVCDNLPHHFAYVMRNNNAYELYIDGVSVGTESGTSATMFTPQPNGYMIGNYGDVQKRGAFPPLPLLGIVDEICCFNGAGLSAARIAAHSLAAKTGWSGDDTGTRVTRLLNTLDWPATLRNIDAGVSLLGPSSWSAGTSVLSVLQSLADTEYGLFFVDPAGRLVWHSRHYRYQNPRARYPLAVFGDSTSAETLRYVDDGFAVVRDETLIRNPVTASRNGGVSVTVKDQTLIDTKYGARTWASPTTQDSLDAVVRDRATWLLSRYKDQGTRIASVTLKPRRIPALWLQVLTLGIGDRITIKRTPAAMGTQIALDQWIEAVTHRITPGDWTTTYVGSPVETPTYCVLDDPARGILDVNTLGY